MATFAFKIKRQITRVEARHILYSGMEISFIEYKSRNDLKSTGAIKIFRKTTRRTVGKRLDIERDESTTSKYILGKTRMRNAIA